MKLTRVLAIASFAGVIASVAQESVTLGVFGYTQVEAPESGFVISGMQFVAGSNNTPESVYGDLLPVGAKIWCWRGDGYSSAEYKAIRDRTTGITSTNWTSDLVFGIAEGYWLEAPASTISTLSGSVPQSAVITNSINTGFQLCSYPYPIDCVVTNLGFTPSLTDKIWYWNGATYQSSEYKAIRDRATGITTTNWTDKTMTVGVGEGFWYEASADAQWVAYRPYAVD